MSSGVETTAEHVDTGAAKVETAMVRSSLADYATGRDNNFNLIRVTMASIVLVHHAFVLTGNPVAATNIFLRLVHQFGEVGVNGFFVVSGFLVARSLLSRPSIVSFAAARILRIFPGLWVMLLVTTGAMAALSTLPATVYFTSPQTWGYLARNATAFLITFDLPGLFRDHPNTAVNGSLWSLKYELLCYAGLAVSSILGLAKRRWPFAVAVLVCAALFYAGPENYFLGLLRRLGLMFGLGSLAAAYATRLPMRWWILLLLAIGAALGDATPLAPVTWAVAFAYGLLWFAYVPGGPVRGFNRLPDISYGLYIYAFPVQQSLIETGLATTPFRNMAFTIVIVSTLATVSWYAIEKPALALKDRFGRPRPVPAAA